MKTWQTLKVYTSHACVQPCTFGEQKTTALMAGTLGKSIGTNASLAE